MPEFHHLDTAARKGEEPLPPRADVFQFSLGEFLGERNLRRVLLIQGKERQAIKYSKPRTREQLPIFFAAKFESEHPLGVNTVEEVGVFFYRLYIRAYHERGQIQPFMPRIVLRNIDKSANCLLIIIIMRLEYRIRQGSATINVGRKIAVDHGRFNLVIGQF